VAQPASGAPFPACHGWPVRTRCQQAERTREAVAALGIPDDITQTALLPVAYLTGTGLHPARRVAARERTPWDTWGPAPGIPATVAPRHSLHT